MPSSSSYTDKTSAAAADVALGQFDNAKGGYRDDYSEINAADSYQQGNAAYSPLQAGNYQSRSPSPAANVPQISRHGSSGERSLTSSPVRHGTSNPALVSPIEGRREPTLPLL